MTIAYQIWKGKTHEELGLPLQNWEARKAILEKFLEQWVGEDETFNRDFIDYINEYRHLPPGSMPGSFIPTPQENQPLPEMPHGVQLVKNLGGSMVDFAKSGFKM